MLIIEIRRAKSIALLLNLVTNFVKKSHF